MKINYGIKMSPPTLEIAKAFGSNIEPVKIEGGQGTCYLSGNIVLKPGSRRNHSWQAELFSNLPDNPHVRFHRPVKSMYGEWMYEGYIAWIFLPGEIVRGRYEEKLQASQEFHKLLKDFKKPDQLDEPRGSWHIANWVALDKKDFDYDREFKELYDQIKLHLHPLPEDGWQIVHADLSGNFLLDPVLSPGIIDFSGVWAPNGFGEGIMLADAIVWHNALPEELEPFKKVPNIKEFAWRGTLTRILEQAEHIKWFGKDKMDAVREARDFQKAIDYLNKYYQ